MDKTWQSEEHESVVPPVKKRSCKTIDLADIRADPRRFRRGRSMPEQQQ